jgi:pyrroloquinoline quinone biosynthesis protein B
MTTEAILLGTAQDAGVPQAGCYCPNCESAHNDPTQRQPVVCLGLVDHTTRQSWLIDATPDFREQLHLLRQLAPDCLLAGLILSHAHIGHYAGLVHVGPEAMNTQKLPVYGTLKMANFLAANAPWSQLVSRGHIELYLLAPEVETALSPNLSLRPVRVPHRDEFSDTMAFVVRGARRQLFYCPDIDTWDKWEYELDSFVAEMDVALLDGCFFSADELPGRKFNEIPHPLVTDTVSRLAGVEGEVRLIHLNHSNPLHAAGAERKWLIEQGFKVGSFGEKWVLG